MLKNALLASTMALSVYALSTNAQAGHRAPEWYIGIEAGVSMEDTARLIVPKKADPEVKFDDGLAILAEAGYRWEDNWRVELELGYRHDQAQCVPASNLVCADHRLTEISQLSQMINVVHDFDLDEDTQLSFGIGLGGVLVDANGPKLIADNDYVFAAQALLQLSHEIDDGIDLVLSYRFMTTDNPELSWKGAGRANLENENHTLSVGLRFDLQQAGEPEAKPVIASAPPPPEPSAGPRQFIVFFGFNKSNLGKEAMDVVHEAASVAMQDGFVSILVTGHTDTVGSNKYNERLSEMRASAVKKALEAQGIPAAGISASGKGETELNVQTADREIEPRNRRAEINLK